jgi:indole-3-glycerol phosphate synthase
MTVNIDTCRELAEFIPENVISVAESGITRRSDVENLMEVGYRRFLVGEALVRSDEPEKLLRSLRGL